jgi:DNA ligase D-like protein (predicted 3'-phosphoesterase)
MHLAQNKQIWYQPPLWDQREPYLRFVVKHHQATTLHDDFRLEACGRLCSWVLPCHPSLIPDLKIPATPVEDHDLEYLLTEVDFPSEESDSVPVAVWDFGTYIPLFSFGDCHDLQVRNSLLRGELTVRLYGQRLKGDFRFFRRGNGWMFYKLPDGEAKLCDQWDDRSILTGRLLQEIT